VILLLALAAGLLVGWGWAHWRGHPYQPPDLRYLWLAFVAFLPQFITIYFPITRGRASDWWVSIILPASQFLFLGFV
jgi:hypothetical protein